MAVDKLVDSTQLDADLTSVANAIRTKGGTSAYLAFPAGFVSAVQAIPTGGGGAQVAEGTITGSNTDTVSLSVSFEPDMVFLRRSDYDNMTAISERSVGATVLARDMFMYYNGVLANATTTSGNFYTSATGTVSTTRASNNYFTYSNGTVTYKCYQGNVNYFRSSLQYYYKCIKWT
jgi:hypothetical protein